MDINWAQHKAHRELAITDHTYWAGLANENGIPILDCPVAESLSAPRARLSPASLMMTVPVSTSVGGRPHPIVDQLIAEGLGKVDHQGELIPIAGPSRWIVIETRGRRRGFRISHCRALGRNEPTRLEIHGTDLLGRLGFFPAMSAPTTWQRNFTTFARDWAGPENVEVQFLKPRDLASMQMVTVADGATLEGPAEGVIRRLISESLEAAFRVAGITDHPIRVSPVESGNASPHLLLRPTDQSIWDSVAKVALVSGVDISADWWWPEDPQPAGLTLTLPTIVIHVAQKEV